MGAFTLTKAEDGLATLVFDLLGEKVNKLTFAALEELSALVDGLAKDASIKFLCVKSGKAGTFIAGADIAEIMGLASVEEAEEKSRWGQDLMNRIEALPFPTVAAIDGACVGGGLELALACTYRLATDDPKTVLGFPEVGLGIVPGFGGTQRSRKICGLVNSLVLVTGGKQVDAKRAQKLHLVDAVYPRAFLDEKLRGFIAKALSGPGKREILARRAKRKPGERFLEGTAIGRSMVYRKTAEAIAKATHGQYPAPLQGLAVIRSTRRKSLEKGLKIERQAFAQLAVTGISKNLIRVYYANEELKKTGRGGDPPRPIASAAVLGAGVMGGAIAWLLGDRDLSVTMVDLDWEFIRRGYQSARGIYDGLKKIGKVDDRVIGLKMHKIEGATDYGHLAGKDLVIEAIVERLDIKRQALARAEDAAGEGAILASNTSSLSITQMADALKRPERFGGLHFFNPVNRMPLVEVIAGEKTSPATVASLVALAKTLRKIPVVVKDSPGFLVNRILMAYLNEAALMVEEGLGFDRIDAAVHRFGMPMGPFTLLDEIGIDIAAEVGKSLAASFASRVRATDIFELLRAKKFLGKKSAAGFYSYNGSKKVNAEAAAILRESHPVRGRGAPTEDEIVERCIFPMINEAAMCLGEGIVERPDFLDMALILGIGFPPFRGGLLRYADSRGLAAVSARLRDFEQRYGPRFAPSEYLCQRDGKGFYE